MLLRATVKRHGQRALQKQLQVRATPSRAVLSKRGLADAAPKAKPEASMPPPPPPAAEGGGGGGGGLLLLALVGGGGAAYYFREELGLTGGGFGEQAGGLAAARSQGCVDACTHQRCRSGGARGGGCPRAAGRQGRGSGPGASPARRGIGQGREASRRGLGQGARGHCRPARGSGLGRRLVRPRVCAPRVAQRGHVRHGQRTRRHGGRKGCASPPRAIGAPTPASTLRALASSRSSATSRA